MASIKRIEATATHKISSGQVVVDLQTAVKEILENSLDAQATNVEVRFKDSGLVSIQVIDNGTGISPDDYESIALKHHTSKLSTFEDLESVATFGFRGEALSSLCALCESVNIVTATQDSAPVGTVLEFNKLGAVTSKSAKVARQRGTTTTLTRLFAPLPVRRKDLERNIKREYGKALHLLTAYALIPCVAQPGQANGIRLAVTNQSNGKAKTTAIRTPGTTTRASVSAIWGPKTLDSLVDLDIEVEFETSKTLLKRLRGSGGGNTSTTKLQVKGLISRPVPGGGRASTDRQFFFVNGRPCNPSKVQKAINDVFREFNGNANGAQAQSGIPFLIVDFILPKHTLDINVSPDKRTIFIHSEDELVVALKAALEREFEKERGRLNVNTPAPSTQSHLQTQRAGREPTQKDASVGKEQPLFLPEVDSEDGPNDQVLAEQGVVERAVKESAQTQKVRFVEDVRMDVDTPMDPDSEVVCNALDEGKDPEPMTVQPSPPIEVLPRYRTHLRHTTSTSTSSTSPSTILSLTPPTAHQPTGGNVGSFIYTSSSRNNHTVRTLSLKRGRDKEKEKGKEKGQMVLSTLGTSWSLEAGSQNKKGSPPKKRIRIRVDEDDDEEGEEEGGGGIVENEEEVDELNSEGDAPISRPREKTPEEDSINNQTPIGPHLEHPKPINASSNKRAKEQRKSLCDMRARLAGYAMHGSQVQLEDDDPEEEEEINVSNDNDKGREDEMNVDTLEGNEIPTLASVLEKSADESSSRHSNIPVAGSPGPVIDLTQCEASVDDEHDSNEDKDELQKLQHIEEEQEVVDVSEEIRRTTASHTGVKVRCDLVGLTSTYKRYADNTIAMLSAKNTRLRAKQTETEMARAIADEAGTAALDTEAAAAALDRVIEKRDFEAMQVIGQFNRGFIIVRRIKKEESPDKTLEELSESALLDDLFIVDQHAADEKYNFERLQRITKIDSQRLVRPKPLEFTAADELLALENAEALKQNGFEIALLDASSSASFTSQSCSGEIIPDVVMGESTHQDEMMSIHDDEDDDGVRRKRVHLVAQPISKNTVFDMKDLEELLHLIQTYPRGEGEVVRCSKARAMFASRACRSSVMVGMPLKHGKMVEVVRHMGTMHQPWNCPHGRPTMRHLSDLAHLTTHNGPRVRRRKAVDWRTAFVV